MEGHRGLRAGRGVGFKQNENWIPQVKLSHVDFVLMWDNHMLMSLEPRFFIHESIDSFARAIVQTYGSPGELAVLFPSHTIACRCIEFLERCTSIEESDHVRIVDLIVRPTPKKQVTKAEAGLTISAAIFPQRLFKDAKAFWQHTGDGISSRRADYCYGLYKDGLLVERSATERNLRSCRGPRRYNRESHTETSFLQGWVYSENGAGSDGKALSTESEGRECSLYIEERYGRNLDMSLAADAKLAIRRRIAGSLTANVELSEAITMPENTETTRMVNRFLERDIYLFPTGMSSIFNTHRILLSSRGAAKSICFG